MNRIKKARESAGMSQKEVALSLKVSAPTVSEWESGKKNPSTRNMAELSKLFRVPIDYLLGIEDEKPYPEHISKLICEDVVRLLKDRGNDANMHLFIPNEVIRKIESGTYSFNNITFPQFAGLLGKTLDDYYLDSAEKAPAPEGERSVSDDDIKFALFGGDGDITDEMYEEVKRFAKLVKLREEAEKKGEL